MVQPIRPDRWVIGLGDGDVRITAYLGPTPSDDAVRVALGCLIGAARAQAGRGRQIKARTYRAERSE